MHLYSAFGFPLDVLDLVPALAHHILDFVGGKLQLKVRLFFAVAVWRQELIQLRNGRLLPILQMQQTSSLPYQSKRHRPSPGADSANAELNRPVQDAVCILDKPCIDSLSSGLNLQL